MKVHKYTDQGMVPIEGEADVVLNHDGPNANRWVKEEDAQAAIDAAHKNGIAQGVASAPTGSWTPPSCKLRGTAADVQVPLHDTRTNQLLNELYHDRARLEGVVKDAVEVMDSILAVLDESEALEPDTHLHGCLTQFVDTHDGD